MGSCPGFFIKFLKKNMRKRDNHEKDEKHEKKSAISRQNFVFFVFFVVEFGIAALNRRALRQRRALP
jgi:hypothetical protein